MNYCKARGVEIVADEPLPPTATDVTTNLIRVRKANPDYVYYQGTVNIAAVIARDAKKIDFKTPVAFSANTVPAQLVQLAGKEAAEGAIIVSWSNPWVGAAPKEVTADLKKLGSFFAENRPGQDAASAGVGYFHGWLGAVMTGEAIRLALEKVAPSDLTGRALKEYGFDRIKNFKDTWDTTGSISYTPTDHRGGQYIKIHTVKDGLSYTLADWFKTPYLAKDQCIWSEYIKPGRWEDILK